METVLKKLGLKNQTEVAVINAPAEILEQFKAALPKAPDEKIQGEYELVLFFAVEMAQVMLSRKELTGAMLPGSRLWICYPKKSSKKYKSDLSRDLLWPVFGEFDYEPVSQFAINDDWTAMWFKPVDEIRSMSRHMAASEKGKKRLEK